MTDKEYDNITLIAAATLASPPRPDASAKSRVTLDEIEAAMDRVLERYGFHAAPPDASAEPVRAFAKAVLHGDDEHRAWLIEAAEAFIANKPLPVPRGKGAAPAQSDAEPVAWRYRIKGMSTWWVAPKDDRTLDYWRASNYEVEPLYTAPPRSDASAGLIEAAEQCTDEIVRECIWPTDHCTIDNEKITAIIVHAIRARAADRSGE